MMDDDMINETELGYIELARRLEAYADQRLSPSTAAMTRMRTVVMNAAHRRAALMAADARFDAAGETTSARAAERAKPADTRTSWRRPAAAIFAGALTLMILAGTAYGARPGGPLYAARLWTEMANLPAGLVARAEAEVDRLEQRLHEAQQASTAGDVSGTEAALSAYSTIVVEATNGERGRPGRQRGARGRRHPSRRRPDPVDRHRPDPGTRGRHAGTVVESTRDRRARPVRRWPCDRSGDRQ